LPLMRIGEASKYTGLSPDKLRMLMDEGTIKSKRISNQRFVSKEALDKFLDS